MIKKKYSNPICGIYCIKNTLNDKSYIGSSRNIFKRRNKHYCELRNRYHQSSYLQNAWNKYGEINFCFSILLLCDEEHLLFYEQLLLNYYISSSLSYNINPYADGHTHSEETKHKISLATAGENNPNYGKRMAEKQKNMIRKALLGRKHTKEEKERQVQAQMGREITPETRQKIRMAHLGKKYILNTLKECKSHEEKCFISLNKKQMLHQNIKE